jgi:hypothetical protein
VAEYREANRVRSFLHGLLDGFMLAGFGSRAQLPDHEAPLFRAPNLFEILLRMDYATLRARFGELDPKSRARLVRMLEAAEREAHTANQT